MSVVFDTNMMLLLVDPNVPVPPDPDTGQPVQEPAKRLNHLFATLQKAREKIIIPTPVLAELVTLAEKAGPAYVSHFHRYGSVFLIEAFDERAAVELALMTTVAKRSSGGLRAGSTESMAKIKFDRQILAIAKVAGAAVIYSDDKNLRQFAKANNIATTKLAELPLPPEDLQQSIVFPEKNGEPPSHP